MEKKAGGLVVAGAVCMALGALALLMLLLKGHSIANTSSLMPWGLWVASYIYLLVLSTGCVLSTFFGLRYFEEQYKAIATRIIGLSLVSLMVAVLVLTVELGKPWRMYNFIISPQPASPMWWMSLLYGIYFIMVLSYFLSLQRGKDSFSLQWGSFLSAVAILLAEGSIFAFTKARPYYSGIITPFYLLSSALLVGPAVVMLIAELTKKTKPELAKVTEPLKKLMTAGLVLLFAAGLLRYGVGLAGGRAGHEIFKHEILTFVIAGIGLGIALPFYLLRKGQYLPAAALVLITQLFSRYDFVVGGFTIPVFRGFGMPEMVHYLPSIPETLLTIGAAGLVLFLYAMADKKGLLESGK